MAFWNKYKITLNQRDQIQKALQDEFEHFYQSKMYDPILSTEKQETYTKAEMETAIKSAVKFGYFGSLDYIFQTIKPAIPKDVDLGV
jgi:hypothetical protein